jgi:hypothetical protein
MATIAVILRNNHLERISQAETALAALKADLPNYELAVAAEEQRAAEAVAREARARPPTTVLKTILVIALIKSADWKKRWAGHFDSPHRTESDVKPGDTGRLGIGYYLRAPLAKIIPSSGDAIKALMDHKLASECKDAKLSKPQAKTCLDFYNFAQQEDQLYFAIKHGVTGVWLARKTSKISWRSEDEERQNPEDQAYENRFSFVIVRNLEGDETKQTSGSSQCTIYKKELAIPLE